MAKLLLVTLSRQTLSVMVTAAAVTLALLALVACSGATPVSPTAKPATTTAPTKQAEPTKAAPAPTKAAEAAKPAETPAKKVEFPVKGRAITYIVPFDAGGAADMVARAIAPGLEKELGTPVQVVDKPGAGSQLGVTELARSRPDGYTIGVTNLPTTVTTYLDPERKAIYNRESFIPVAGYAVDPDVLAVKADSPYKTAKELIEAARANPEKIRMASASGKLSPPHLGILLTEKAANVKFATVLFDGGGASTTALVGGHVDAAVGSGGNYLSQVKGGQLRAIAVMDREPSPYFPDAKTMVSQGYDVIMMVNMGISVPAGTPKEIVDILTAATKKAMESGEVKSRLDSVGVAPRFMSGADFAARWTETESTVKPLMSLAKQ